jgi:taurine dioxygenase
MLQLKPTHFGVEVSGVDLREPLDATTQQALRDAYDEYGIVVFHDQTLTKQQLVTASCTFGELEIHPLSNAIDKEVPEILVVSTHGVMGDVEPENDEYLVGKIDWHTDHTYIPVPNRGALMYAVQIPPEGGMTGFVDRQATYAALPYATKERIANLSVIMSWRYAQEGISKNPSFRTDEGAKMLALDKFPDLAQPLVYAHPVNGRKVLNVPPMWSAGIVEMPGAEGRKLLDELIQHSLQPQFVYWHQYRPGDAVMWDNWRQMHAAQGTKGKYRRLMWRTTFTGTVQLGRPLESGARTAA